jgi:nitrogen fixation-related uncharacterized protein
MTTPLEGQTFVFMWIGFLLLMSSGIALFFLWAIRAGQFSRQDRARFLALQAAIPPLPAKTETGGQALPGPGRPSP